ncbi:MAG TPA: ATP phosphoribosyltransferase regulatory subunit [Burkholderiales bacterium]|nr:ATP phosphoribosyltransferase regulatory subunit [Burkholderiales bacterium]
MRNWLLPENIQDILPPQARRVEALRARLLELFRVHGYQLVMPPLLEYVESLLTGTGEDLDLRTFKLVDQLSGRMMGVRADITPQVARIDAHLLNRSGVTRLCYCGSVLHTRPRGEDATREPLQIGAEIYGHSGIESDLEIQQLLAKSLAACGRRDAHIDIGHVAVFRALCNHGGIAGETEWALQAALEAKDTAELALRTEPLDARSRAALRLLPELYGEPKVLDRAAALLPEFPEIRAALADLRRLSAEAAYPVSIDLGDLRGYHYHSGAVFTAYVAGRAKAVAFGGRYDKVGEAFGRARPATGFSLDLTDFSALVPADMTAEKAGILSPCVEDAALAALVEKLRGEGEIVVPDLPGHESVRDELGCDRELVLVKGKWQVKGMDK